MKLTKNQINMMMKKEGISWVVRVLDSRAEYPGSNTVP